MAGRARSTAEMVGKLLERRAIPAARVRTPGEVLPDPMRHARGTVTPLLHPGTGAVRAVGIGNPIRFSYAHAQFDEPAQELAAANEQVYGGLVKLSAFRSPVSSMKSGGYGCLLNKTLKGVLLRVRALVVPWGHAFDLGETPANAENSMKMRSLGADVLS